MAPLSPSGTFVLRGLPPGRSRLLLNEYADSGLCYTVSGVCCGCPTLKRCACWRLLIWLFA